MVNNRHRVNVSALNSIDNNPNLILDIIILSILKDSGKNKSRCVDSDSAIIIVFNMMHHNGAEPISAHSSSDIP